MYQHHSKSEWNAGGETKENFIKANRHPRRSYKQTMRMKNSRETGVESTTNTKYETKPEKTYIHTREKMAFRKLKPKRTKSTYTRQVNDKTERM